MGECPLSYMIDSLRLQREIGSGTQGNQGLVEMDSQEVDTTAGDEAPYVGQGRNSGPHKKVNTDEIVQNKQPPLTLKGEPLNVRPPPSF